MHCASKPRRLELNCPISAAAKAQNDPLRAEVISDQGACRIIRHVPLDHQGGLPELGTCAQ